jgi:signal transduction histidine kinase
MQEKYKIEYYADKITKQKRTIKEFKEFTFGTLESFLYKVAITKRDGKVLYSSFKNVPKYDPLKTVYIEDDSVLYNNTKEFLHVGKVRIIIKKDFDYSDIENRIFILAISIVTFFILCMIFLYVHTSKVHNIMNKNLDMFLKDAMHEIRTPIGVIQINLEFLESSIKPTMALKRAQGGLRNITSVYESIEYFIKNEKITYKKELVNISPLLEKRVEFFHILAEIKNLEVISNIEENIFLHVNDVEIQRLIDNNLSNAIKYSKKDTKIEIVLHKNSSSVVLSFTNYGEQIKDTNKIFQRYYRGDSIRGGFGLGLNMVEHICGIYDININVNSTKDGKSTFTYTMPSKMIKGK